MFFPTDNIEPVFKIYRVTRLSEFSPFGPLFTLGSFLEFTEAAQFLGLLWYTVKVLTKLVWLHFG
jgi:hypothetical protein